jgi:hypothetical protein
MDRKATQKTRLEKAKSREDRLKSALKANLARRKAQVRGRKDPDAACDAPSGETTDQDKE